MKEMIKIKGMHCKSCVEKIESKLKMLKGVDIANADLLTDNVTVEFDNNIISLEQIKSEVELLGYSCCNPEITAEITEKPEVKEEAKEMAVAPRPADATKGPKKKTLMQGIAFGLVPHIGCIAFIIGSVLGVTFLTSLFQPLLMSPYFFYGLIGLSLTFATISSAYYLKKNGLLSVAGATKKWKYLSTMYGSTIGVNLILFLFIFPMVANISFAVPAGVATGLLTGDSATVKLAVEIPCSGHALLISGELKKVNGVLGIEFSNPNYFTVTYDPSKTSVSQIAAIDVFKTYKATIVTETGQASKQQVQVAVPAGSTCSSGGCGCGAPKI